jgi:hypothetical protein
VEVKLNISDEEFERVMKEIDDELVSENVQVPARQMRGWMLFCKKRQLHGTSFTDPISVRVLDWFKTRYGERINLDFGLGYSIEVIRGDLLRCRCSVFFGEIHLFSHAAFLGRIPEGPAVNRPALVNVLDHVHGMTPAFAGSLRPEDRRTLLRRYATSLEQCSRIGDADAPAFVPEGRADLRESIEHMFRNEPQFGLSKWAALQGAEKFLKAYIQQQGDTPERTHLLWKLAGTAESLGLRPIEKKILAQAECSPEARYQGKGVSRAEAVASYQAALQVAGTVALQLKTKSVWRTEVFAEGYLTFQGLVEKVPMIAIRRFATKAPWD